MCVTTRPILSYIINNVNWEQDLRNLGIKIKYKGDLAIFNYGIEADFNNELVRDARGIIIDIKNFRIVCYPFTKFGNYYESYADAIDWSTAQVQEKIDGSLLKLYRYNHEWHWATNACIDAVDANIQGSNLTFMDVIRMAANYNDIDFKKLDKNKTYIFELVSPHTKVVINYDYPYLYHIGTRSNLTGLEYNDDIGIIKPRTYDIVSPDLDEVIDKAKHLNDMNEEIEHEGFVVVDADYHRIKIKNPLYLALHHNVSRNVLTKKDAIEIIRGNDEEIIYAIGQKPHLDVQLKFYQWQYAQFCYELDEYIRLKRGLYFHVYKEDRKAFAQSVSEDKFRVFAFKAIDRIMDTTDQIIKDAPQNLILKFIEDYN